jgi:hypothetical protein
MRLLLTGIAFLLSLGVALGLVAALALYVVGPHAGLLPAWLEPCVSAAAWFAVIGLPLWTAARVWARLDRSGASDTA